MNDYKPAGLIKNIYFKHLTFGDAPIKIDNVWVEDEGEEHVMLEVKMPCRTKYTSSLHPRGVHSPLCMMSSFTCLP